MLKCLARAGTGILLDAIMDAIELAEALLETGEIDYADAQEIIDEAENAKRNGRKVQGALIGRKVRRCGICRQPGHNRRTCPHA